MIVQLNQKSQLSKHATCDLLMRLSQTPLVIASCSIYSMIKGYLKLALINHDYSKKIR